MSALNKIQNIQRIENLIFKLACIFCPSITFWMQWPLIREWPPLLITKNLNLFPIYIGASIWVGVFSGPGFIYALFKNDLSGLGKWLKRWIGVSLHTAFYASLGVFIISIWSIRPAPFALGTIICTYLVLKKHKAQKIST